MKTPSNKSQGLYLKKRNNRWKWMAGATAATAAGVTAPQASAITINLLNNYINASGGNHLNADLTGDGHPDMTIAGAFNFFTSNPNISYGTRGSVGAFLNGVLAFAFHSGHQPSGTVQLGSEIGRWSNGFGTPSLNGKIPITFRDPHINNGKLTKGFLEVTVSVFGPHGSAEIDLDSLSFNVPDQGSTLALLAMGATSVLALRRWRTAQNRS